MKYLYRGIPVINTVIEGGRYSDLDNLDELLGEVDKDTTAILLVGDEFDKFKEDMKPLKDALNMRWNREKTDG